MLDYLSSFVEAILVVAAVVDCGQLSLPPMASGE